MVYTNAAPASRGPGLAARRTPARVARSRPRVAPCRAELSKSSKVLITGAGGRTGQLVLKKLSDNGVAVRGMFRTEKSKSKVAKQLEGAEAEVDLVVGDVSSPEDVRGAVEGCTHLVVLSSAKPQIKKRSLVRIVLKKLLRMDPGRPSFRWIENGAPEVVDYLGGKAQIDAARAAGLEQVVWVGSMGGTQSDNFLNTIGDGKILLWKRKAEKYLMDSGVKFTIVHPGGLLNEKEGERELVVDVDDKILEGEQRSVPRGDVADVVVGCLGEEAAYDLAFDLASKKPEDGKGGAEVTALLATLGGRSCDYKINDDDVDSLVLSDEYVGLEESITSMFPAPAPVPAAAAAKEALPEVDVSELRWAGEETAEEEEPELRWVGETTSSATSAEVTEEKARDPADAWYSW